MRIGLISDVHANRVALEAVLADLPTVDDLACVGDVVGYNPWPAECVEIVRERCSVTVEGNHDRAVETPERYFHNEMARAGLAHAKRELSSDQRAWLSSLPRTASVGDGRVLLVHDHPEYRDRYVRPPEFEGLGVYLDDHDALILGHTHIQHAASVEGGLVVNPGSVGQPRDGDPRAAYGVYDTDTGSVDLRRVDYDVEAVRDGVEAADLPDRTGRRLTRGA